MTFRKGDPRPPGAGRKKGSANKPGFDVKAALRLHGPELAAELVRLALHAKNEATRTLAIRECFDRMLGKPTIPLEGSSPTAKAPNYRNCWRNTMATADRSLRGRMAC
jgi:hypothetical protein